MAAIAAAPEVAAMAEETGLARILTKLGLGNQTSAVSYIPKVISIISVVAIIITVLILFAFRQYMIGVSLFMGARVGATSAFLFNYGN